MSAIIHGGHCVLHHVAAHCHWCRSHPGENGFPVECPHGETPDTAARLLPKPGAGAHLKALLARFGIHATPDCKCLPMAAKMDALGPAWCRAHLAEIVAVMHEEATRRRLPFADSVAEALIRAAIRRAERD